MATPKTLTELVEEVAIILGPMTPGGTLADSDNTRIRAVVTPALEELNDIVIIDEEEIPNDIFLPLANYVAERCGPSYGRKDDRGAREIAKHDIRVIIRSRPTREPLTVDYF